jgi:hypothetical protein
MKTVIMLSGVLVLFALNSNAQSGRPSPTNPAPDITLPTNATTPTSTPLNTTPIIQPATQQKPNYLDKSNNALSSANNAVTAANGTGSNAVTSATNASTQAKALAGQVGGLFAKKHSAADAAAHTTVISVKGATYATLKKINESIRNCSDVQDSQSKFSADESIITVTHLGSTDKLLSSIQKKSTLVTDQSISNFEEGKISIVLK